MAKKKEKDAYTASDPYVPQTYGHEMLYCSFEDSIISYQGCDCVLD